MQNDRTRPISNQIRKRRKKAPEKRFQKLEQIKHQASTLPEVPICLHCQALRFFKEPPGFCCASGKISLPLPKMHPQLWDLFTNQIWELAKKFRIRCRSYNNSFAFTSLGMTTDSSLSKNTKGMYTLKVQGTVSHYVEDLEPNNGQPKCLQLYFYSTEDEITNRMATFDKLDADIIQIIMSILAENPYERFFRRLREIQELPKYTIVLRADPNLGKTYNLPTVEQVAAIWHESEDPADHQIRDIRVYTNSGKRYSVNYYYGCYDPLQYPLLFPYGEPGWQAGIQKLDPNALVGPQRRRVYCARTLKTSMQNDSGESLLNNENENLQKNKKKTDNVSMREYYCYLFQIRNSDETNILRTGRIVQQFAIDIYIKIETQRLDFLRDQNNTSRVETLQGIKDAMASDGNMNSADMGRKIILPTGFQGGPRDLRCRYMNALALVQKYGKPDFFITMTCNTKWKEIQEQLLPGEEAMNRPDLLVRVFHAKNEKLKKHLIEKRRLGDVAAYFYVIEFQKRGLPHAHWLIVLENRYKITSPQAYDTFVSAEIPDPQAYPHLHNCVKKHMMHGPCGDLNKENVCMLERKTCKNKYPKDFAESTSHKPNSYPNYRRRNDRRKVFTRNHELDNRWVIPYNPFLLSKFDCHMNVEICSNIKMVKYLYKYVCKGKDNINYSVTEESEKATIDEIKNFQSARWLCAPEAMWRIYGFVMNEMHPPVNQLHIHLPNRQPIFFRGDREIDEVLQNPKSQRTQLTEFFQMNRNDTLASKLKLLYREFPQHFIWKEDDKYWHPRKRGTMVGRLVTVNPIEGDRYYLRVLLNHVKGPTSFNYLKTVNDLECNTFREAALLRGLLQSDSDLQETIKEACGFEMPYALRRLFATILLHNSPTDPKALWEEFKDYLSDDLMRETTAKEQAYRRSLQSIDIFLQYHNRTVDDYSLVSYNIATTQEDINYIDYKNELEIPVSDDDLNSIYQLNSDQKKAFDEIIAAVDSREGGAFFVDGPGGTGKTFLYKALLASVRSTNKIALAVASSGVAASLLPGGRTAHNRFKFPTEIEESVSCAISKQSTAARLIVNAKLIIWDEATMANKKLVEALDNLLQDLCGNQNTFGGKTVVLGGDFRQTVPVVTGKGRKESINACLVMSHLWPRIRKISLTQNMRAKDDPEFMDFLMRIGNGTEDTDEKGQIALPTSMCITHSENEYSLQSLIDHIFPSFDAYRTNPYSVMDRAILTPKNDCVDDINDALIDKFPGKLKEYYSMDLTDDPTQQAQYQDFLNGNNVPGLPPHLLKLKLNCPVMLMRNIDPSEGMCNGTRMIITTLGDRVIGATIASGEHKGRQVLIPKIPLEQSDRRKCPVPFKRKQFPIKLCFAITINKSQGQTLERVGIYLPQAVFSHGQLYVALSRARRAASVKVLIRPPTVDSEEYTKTKNVVFQEILQPSQ